MKKIVACYVIISLFSCEMFPLSETTLINYPLTENSSLRVFSVGTGATTKSFTFITKTVRNKIDTVKIIDGSFENAKVNLIRINDSVFKLKFTNTMSEALRGDTMVFLFNINDREKR